MGSSAKRARGPNKRTPWSRSAYDGISVLRLALDTSDARQRARIEAVFEAAYSVKRALQRAARDKCRAYWAATHERAKSPAAVRARLGLSQNDFAHAAYEHLDAAPHLRRYVTKALAMHVADSVWTGIERHLFRDNSGKRHGPPGEHAVDGTVATLSVRRASSEETGRAHSPLLCVRAAW